MTEALVPIVLGIVAVAWASAVGPRLRVAGPLLLVLVGLGVSLLPFVPAIDVEPELILVGVLPPLLYSAAVSLPAIEFRRDFRPIAGLSVLLVVISALAIGGFLYLMIPGINFMIALALGAVISPTDAVATSIVKRLGISRRVVTMLEGESLLNDATSLVILRTAVVAFATSSFSFGNVLGSFAWAVLSAIVIGAVIGILNLRLRAWVGNSAAATAIGFVAPFAAYLPTEELGGSGLVAAVVAGIVTGQGASRWFTPEQRISDANNWRTVELVLEGGVFLIMGLELREIVTAIGDTKFTFWHALGLAAIALAIVLLARSGWVTLLVWLQGRRAARFSHDQLTAMSRRLDAAATAMERGNPRAFAELRHARSHHTGEQNGTVENGVGEHADSAHSTEVERTEADPRGHGEPPSESDARRRARRIDAERRRANLVRTRITRTLADADYYQAQPLGWKHGTVIVWSGMRGVVTLAAAQTLPETPNQPLLVLVAFLVAVGSLMLQGFTLPWLVNRLKLADGTEVVTQAEEARLHGELAQATTEALDDSTLVRADGTPYPPEVLEKIRHKLTTVTDPDRASMKDDFSQMQLTILTAMRERLVQLSSGGEYSTASLRHQLATLDAMQVSIEVQRSAST